VRATVDTSGWVQAVLSRGGTGERLRAAFHAGRFELVTSEALHAETEEVLGRPALVRSPEARGHAWEVREGIRTHAEFIPITGELRVGRDPDDEHVVETALRGRVDVLVTMDKDLLEDAQVRHTLGTAGIRVLTVAEFLEALDAEDAT
jgi:putative PIN family toxin of toxin-antitoxin system